MTEAVTTICITVDDVDNDVNVYVVITVNTNDNEDNDNVFSFNQGLNSKTLSVYLLSIYYT